jgi:predicted Zn-dependent protease
MLGTARSFRPISDEERRSIRVTRLRVETARAGESLVALGQRSGSAWSPAESAVQNALFPDHRFEGGELVKVAREEPYIPR